MPLPVSSSAMFMLRGDMQCHETKQILLKCNIAITIKSFLLSVYLGVPADK